MGHVKKIDIWVPHELRKKKFNGTELKSANRFWNGSRSFFETFGDWNGVI